MDETGIEVFLHRPRAWSPAGVAVPGWVSGRKFERMDMVACRRYSQVMVPMRYASTMDTGLF
ncbi:MAG: hypothetical protein FWH21_08790 [Kiritimatiellaeota bacterium]|nr:hypothetical protein [Kiritimatiellota bacterium]